MRGPVADCTKPRCRFWYTAISCLHVGIIKMSNSGFLSRLVELRYADLGKTRAVGRRSLHALTTVVYAIPVSQGCSPQGMGRETMASQHTGVDVVEWGRIPRADCAAAQKYRVDCWWDIRKKVYKRLVYQQRVVAACNTSSSSALLFYAAVK